MRLFLQFRFHTGGRTSGQFGGEMFAQEFHGAPQVAICTQTHPHKMQMIGPEHVNGTKQIFARSRMEQQFAEVQMKPVIQPAGGAAFEGNGSLDNSDSAITFRGEAGQVVLFRFFIF